MKAERTWQHGSVGRRPRLRDRDYFWYIYLYGGFPGKRLSAFKEKSFAVNPARQNSDRGRLHGAFDQSDRGVFPFCRRVVYWLLHDSPAEEVAKEDRIGMMQFASRLDMYLLADPIKMVVKRGEWVRAGKTIVARLEGVPL